MLIVTLDSIKVTIFNEVALLLLIYGTGIGSVLLDMVIPFNYEDYESSLLKITSLIKEYDPNIPD